MEFKCEHCNKSYKSYQSRWNHIKKYNTDESIPNVLKCIPEGIPKSIPNGIHKDENKFVVLTCKFCKKIYSTRQNRWKHEQKCKINNIPSEIIEKLKQQIEEIKSTQKQEMDKFKNDCMKAMKIHPKTLQKINKQLNNYGNINNFTVIALGKEKLDEVLTDKQKLKILKSCSNAPASLTNLIYSNPELEKYRNIYITNLSNDVGYIYDDEKKQYIVKLKSKIINQYSDERLWNIESFYDELKGKLDDNVIKKIETLIQNYFNNDEENTKIKKELLISLYNNKVNVKEIYEKVNEIEL